ncbi:uncharacterized protein MONOS_8003 [Monocercomonoides exilis]|uniref:uncharacterized protein n=1 Tax=Monocercomonoides exilis TaxID=2049356 RepID=UPI00355A0030|nr:hypothetical protein MONOS_8003 [Monocercomonoides exilis]|eukprot:MONOS_8003.1-p1 / transcript=MONOS_8003.1 / gene=MONOS_8003 / organism=Monocercomonoides_exilis_PA203 / gene_product=unspecified product / transcript_product=unspecified product / location=Mono_scaffold00290:34881-35324(+) / protein_length=148 / sequence_SO=supercontig / SO=protein_coding / is_pseudo=false
MNAFKQPTQNSAFPLASFPQTLQTGGTAPTAEPKASQNVPHRRYTHNIPMQNSQLHRAISLEASAALSETASCVCIFFSCLSISSISATYEYDAVTADASERSIAGADDGFSFSEDFFSSLFRLRNGETDMHAVPVEERRRKKKKEE